MPVETTVNGIRYHCDIESYKNTKYDPVFIRERSCIKLCLWSLTTFTPEQRRKCFVECMDKTYKTFIDDNI
jgi:hypothetical protein